LSLQRWSESQSLDADIVVVDAMGELINIYAVSDIVILGGAFAPVACRNSSQSGRSRAAQTEAGGLFGADLEGDFWCGMILEMGMSTL